MMAKKPKTAKPDEPELTGGEQVKTGKEATYFKPGQSGNPNGRPTGARQKLSEAFITEIQADFEKNGKAAIAKVRDEDAPAYLRVVAGIIPKDITVRTPLEQEIESLTDDQIHERIRKLESAYAAVLAEETVH